jgi:hypothetical protein
VKRNALPVPQALDMAPDLGREPKSPPRNQSSHPAAGMMHYDGCKHMSICPCSSVDRAPYYGCGGRWFESSQGCVLLAQRDVAQFGSAPVWGTGGPGFKSRLPDWIRVSTVRRLHRQKPV